MCLNCIICNHFVFKKIVCLIYKHIEHILILLWIIAIPPIWSWMYFVPPIRFSCNSEKKLNTWFTDRGSIKFGTLSSSWFLWTELMKNPDESQFVLNYISAWLTVYFFDKAFKKRLIMNLILHFIKQTFS